MSVLHTAQPKPRTRSFLIARTDMAHGPSGDRRPIDLNGAAVVRYEDAIGALSRLSSEGVLKALAMPTRGEIFDLGLEINDQMPKWEGLAPFSIAFYHTPENTRSSEIQSSDEIVVTSLHHSTHVDALVHVQRNDVVFGERAASDIRDDRGWHELGADTIAPIISRCVLLDVAGHRGIDLLPDGYQVTIEDIEQICAAKSIAIEPGDAVLIRTGKVTQFWTDQTAFMASQPGVSAETAIWLYEAGMSILGTDTPGTEPRPAQDESTTTHVALLVERGVHLIENLYLEGLASRGIVKALFVCVPLKFTGATASFVRPLAIV